MTHLFRKFFEFDIDREHSFTPLPRKYLLTRPVELVVSTDWLLTTCIIVAVY